MLWRLYLWNYEGPEGERVNAYYDCSSWKDTADPY